MLISLGLNWLVRFLMNMGCDIPLQICYNMQILKGCLFFYMQVLKKSYLRPKVGKSRPLAYGVAFKDSFGNKPPTTFDVGPKEQLDVHKIKIVLEQPFVGKDMADNPMNTIFIPSPTVVEPTIVQLVGITRFGSLREMYIHLFFVFVITKTFLFIIFIILAFLSF
ncbi:putative FAD/NAD(P)-binding domain superfamily [Helianthus anomalus]